MCSVFPSRYRVPHQKLWARSSLVGIESAWFSSLRIVTSRSTTSLSFVSLWLSTAALRGTLFHFGSLFSLTAHQFMCPASVLQWENRCSLIVEEITRFNPDVICLEEVDHFEDFFEPTLLKHGYTVCLVHYTPALLNVTQRTV
jgi:mRNA deadenylase 3'-5' endonuclease subunit Ccr4